VVVHHVEVHEVGAGRDHPLHLLAETGEVGRQDAGSDAVALRHARLSKTPGFYPFPRLPAFKK
jgi:hypothetical protein